jgi:hypothetical protein
MLFLPSLVPPFRRLRGVGLEHSNLRLAFGLRRLAHDAGLMRATCGPVSRRRRTQLDWPQERERGTAIGWCFFNK